MRAFAEAGSHADFSIEAFHDVFWDDESQANTLRIHSPRISHFPKKLEKLPPILSRDAHAAVDDRNYQLVPLWMRLINVIQFMMVILFHDVVKLIVGVRIATLRTWRKICKIRSHNIPQHMLFRRCSFHILHNNFNLAAILCKLECIGLQIHQNLFYSLFLWANDMILVTDGNIVILPELMRHRWFWRKIEKLGTNPYILGICLILLNFHNIRYSSLNIERFRVLLKPAILNLRIPQYILHIQHQQLWRWSLYVVSTHDFNNDFLNLSDHILWNATTTNLNKRLQRLDHNLLDLTLIDDGIEGVSHFVRNGRIDETEQLSLRLGCII